ncbi:TPA: SUF system NifU family Fe-S cluster assembly protein [Candidatus Woesearchaeota archaeon]|nr:SUF system NifU family Fe-S cluster assembly protein [Candidatus Woesearchaeota archaeon]
MIKNDLDLPSSLTEEEELYKENILDHYKHPHHKEELKNPSLTHRENNPLCGDVITIFAHLEKGKLTQVTFTGHGCAISQAGASLLTEYVQKKNLAEVKQITTETVRHLLGIPISTPRLKCALLSLKALHKGIAHWEEKHDTQC